MQSRRLSRRTVLRGLGAAVALPLLDVMPAASSGFGAAASKPGAAASANRLAYLYFPNGIRPRHVVSGGDRAGGTARQAERVDAPPRAVQGASRHPHQHLDAQGQRPRGRTADVADRRRLRPPRRQRRRGVGRPGRGSSPARRDHAPVARAVGAGRGLLLELAAAKRHLVVGPRPADVARDRAPRRLRPHVPPALRGRDRPLGHGRGARRRPRPRQLRQRRPTATGSTSTSSRSGRSSAASSSRSAARRRCATTGR